ncbi:hypothetical protein DSH65_13760 [Enterococcus faecalis]|uniref:Uncharacterized protein n=2 Tax=Enterococcus faecalis TaxID=1351 RepID=A0ABD7IZU8_ENTFL|nr:hypothetical protein [Enterococcus faecalis]EGO2744004.1 hypothetical protein [Enterococcus faecalis]EGO2804001.1 hypothetical protein [Enterococcus faecalis]EGO2812707.1 hypothetical protein [Enterococcus faecalis]EGO2831748.1 hypothetical protein [Enterococcus faecalis]EGO5087788.1 hypothetical protein [Enterococcus faecalis]
MGNKGTDKNSYSLLGMLILLILLYIPLILLSKKLYIATSLYVLLISIWIVWINRNIIVKNTKIFFTERKKLKNLDYYRITDDNKIIDLEKRRNIFSLFRDMTMGTFLIAVVNIMAISSLIRHFLGESPILNLITAIVISLITLVGYGGILASIVYKYTTTIYVAIPMISAIIYFSFLDPLVSFLPDFAQLAGYLMTTIILYFILTYAFPAHILRKLNSKTILISSFTTILASFFSQILQFFFTSYFQNEHYLLTVEAVKETTDISEGLKSIILDNTELIDIINHFLLKEGSNLLASITGLIITALTISYIIGGLIINHRIRKNKLKAKSLYRELIKKEHPSYSVLIECSFYGGEEYENLLLNNNMTLKIIMENEAAIKIPDISRKTRLIAWWKRNSIMYSTFNDIRQIFEK